MNPNFLLLATVTTLFAAALPTFAQAQQRPHRNPTHNIGFVLLPAAELPADLARLLTRHELSQDMIAVIDPSFLPTSLERLDPDYQPGDRVAVINPDSMRDGFLFFVVEELMPQELICIIDPDYVRALASDFSDSILMPEFARLVAPIDPTDGVSESIDLTRVDSVDIGTFTIVHPDLLDDTYFDSVSEDGYLDNELAVVSKMTLGEDFAKSEREIVGLWMWLPKQW